MEQDTIRQVLEIAIYSGRVMLENGAETYRVEETINRICASQNIHVESFVIPTGILFHITMRQRIIPMFGVFETYTSI